LDRRRHGDANLVGGRQERLTGIIIFKGGGSSGRNGGIIREGLGKLGQGHHITDSIIRELRVLTKKARVVNKGTDLSKDRMHHIVLVGGAMSWIRRRLRG
jgi:hypothetical protein